VLNVVGGKAGCYGAWSASNLTIDLTPNPDGGPADASSPFDARSSVGG
jgi:hypothetical protein